MKEVQKRVNVLTHVALMTTEKKIGGSRPAAREATRKPERLATVANDHWIMAKQAHPALTMASFSNVFQCSDAVPPHI